jgi:cell division protease FtsH
MLDILAQETRALIDQCYERALTLLRENRSRLDSLVEQLLARETLNEAEIYAAAGLQRRTDTAGPKQEDNHAKPVL